MLTFYAVKNRRTKASVKKAYVYSKLFRTERAYTVRYSYESFVHVEYVSIVVVIRRVFFSLFLSFNFHILNLIFITVTVNIPSRHHRETETASLFIQRINQMR